ncbi:hypothetical protein LSTR_LSTR014026 [Laodelphax striatellus]|uniref:NAD-dependent epimerase/dehydratase domain-containing protein n=1 Tax=Laodelphax striatellus TaxID=195883 RepID=A0A482WJ57_LAOST|nr:hypothetical protein LSTR_LSTR014026 [Laodelphax striatellus]
MADNNDKPKVIVLGGCGFIGRNLVAYLVSNDLISYLRIVDKVPPQTAWLSTRHKKYFEDPRVEFKSANLIIPESCQNAFAGELFDYVINCAGETKLGQTEPIYREGILKLSLNCAELAAKQKCKRFVEISSGQMASNDKEKHKESDKCDPWLSIAKFKLQVEEQLEEIEGLNYTVLRPAIVYGIGDRTGIVPRLVLGAVYRHLGESMKLLWGRDLVTNTCHVDDVCRAVWHVAVRGGEGGGGGGGSHVYNVVDDSQSTQGSLSDLVSEMFNINHDYYGNLISKIAKVEMSTVVDEVNDKHLAPWAELCALGGVNNTPLSPYIQQELMYEKHLNLDASKLAATGFQLAVPRVTKKALQEILDDHIEMNLFPNVFAC